MAFNLRSGNKARFKSLGSSSRSVTSNKTSSSPFISKKQDKKNKKEWNKQTSDGSIVDPTGGSGADWLRKDLDSPGYQKRLENEIKMNKGNTEYLRAPNEKELKERSDRSIVRVDAKDGNVISDRKSRLDNTIYNAPSTHDKEGKYIGYAHADNVMKTSDGNRLMPGANIYYQEKYFNDGSQKNRMHDLNIHEGAHAITASDFGMLEGTKNLLLDAKGGDHKDAGSINKPQEVYARYKVAQNFLQKQGIFDAFSGEEFTNEHVKAVEKMMEGVNEDNYRSKGIPYEVFTFFGDGKTFKGHGFNKKLSKKDMKTIFNNVAQETPGGGGFEVQDDFGGSQYIS
tara:strand:- start:1317 stop:2339 length:1023 start_codon:yes stop_codon:yes gene_type:complete